jgi:Uma2 family endonuclease
MACAYTENALKFNAHQRLIAMGQNTAHETLALRWTQLCNDPLMTSFPGKVELNGYGVIEMSPASTRHARIQAAVTAQMSVQLPRGEVLTECPLLTSDGIRVPDVAWGSTAFFARHGDTTPLPQAPEICVEVRSPSNTDEEMAHKTQLFLEAGAVEVWILSEDGTHRVFDAAGEQAASRYSVQFSLPAPSA